MDPENAGAGRRDAPADRLGEPIAGGLGEPIADRLAGWLARVGSESDADVPLALTSLRRFVLLAVAVESWNALRYTAYREDLAFQTLLACAQLACLVAGWLGWRPRVATAASAVLLAIGIALAFPFNANHQFVELWLLGFLSLADGSQPAAGRAVLQGARWMLVIGFFWAGVQKVLWGQWFGGEFLAHRIATDPAFDQVFQLMLTGAEMERLRALEPIAGAGPFRAAGGLLPWISNGAWIAELALAGLLCWGPTRRLAALGVLVFLFAIELGARELFFGGLMANLALLFLGARVHRAALPVFAVAYLYLFAMAVGWLPHWSFG